MKKFIGALLLGSALVFGAACEEEYEGVEQEGIGGAGQEEGLYEQEGILNEEQEQQGVFEEEEQQPMQGEEQLEENEGVFE